LLTPFALHPAFPSSETGRHARDYYEVSAPPEGHQPATDPPPPPRMGSQTATIGWFPRSPSNRSAREVPSYTPAASPHLRRRHSAWPPHRWN